MNTLAQRTTIGDEILKAKFTKRQLKQTADDIRNLSQRKMSGFRSSFWQDRSFSVTDNQMDYEHLKVHRFVDMRRRVDATGTPQNKKSHPIHNRIVMGQYSQLTKELAYGFTEAVKEQLRTLED